MGPAAMTNQVALTVMRPLVLFAALVVLLAVPTASHALSLDVAGVSADISAQGVQLQTPIATVQAAPQAVSAQTPAISVQASPDSLAVQSPVVAAQAGSDGVQVASPPLGVSAAVSSQGASVNAPAVEAVVGNVASPVAVKPGVTIGTGQAAEVAGPANNGSGTSGTSDNGQQPTASRPDKQAPGTRTQPRTTLRPGPSTGPAGDTSTASTSLALPGDALLPERGSATQSVSSLQRPSSPAAILSPDSVRGWVLLIVSLAAVAAALVMVLVGAWPGMRRRLSVASTAPVPAAAP